MAANRGGEESGNVAQRLRPLNAADDSQPDRNVNLACEYVN